MSTRPQPLGRVSAVEALVRELRERILDGELAPGERLVERVLTERYAVARHTLRSALRTLSAEGLVVLEPGRGASVAALQAADLESMFELRTALEIEAARLALAHGDGRLPGGVRDAVAHLRDVCDAEPPWHEVVAAHDGVHRAIVAAARSPRIDRAYDTLSAELALFVVALRPTWSLERMAEHHERLIAGLEQDGTDALRRHLIEGRHSVLSQLPG